jgi:hypothetical protein
MPAGRKALALLTAASHINVAFSRALQRVGCEAQLGSTNNDQSME